MKPRLLPIPVPEALPSPKEWAELALSRVARPYDPSFSAFRAGKYARIIMRSIRDRLWCLHGGPFPVTWDWGEGCVVMGRHVFPDSIAHKVATSMFSGVAA